jgi:large subunit ribosomal protein L15
MELHSLKDMKPGVNRRRKRVGIGEGSGRGKTSTRGQKGQKARSGGSVRTGFESGHIPLYRKLPHRGFNNKNFATTYAIVNLADLERVEATEIDAEVLAANGLIRQGAPLVKVLGDGKISRAVTITADKFSASAVKKIEAAGGKTVIKEASAKKEVTAKAKEDDASEG